MKKPRTAIGLAYLTAALAGAVALVVFAPAAAVAHPKCGVGIIEPGEHGEEGEHDESENCNEIEIEAGESTFLELGEPVGQAVNGDTFGGAFTWSPNMTPLGFSARSVPTSGTGANLYNSDLAFWGNRAYQGTYAGFRILDISNPADPVQLLNYTGCSSTAGQGDVVVWENILVRSYDAAASSTATCGGVTMGSGFEGVSIFNVSNPTAPVFIRNVRMASSGNGAGAPATGCGSHTATAVPDEARGQLYLYIGGSSGTCTGMDIVRINMSNPNDAQYLRRVSASRQCHDINVLMGDANLAMCAGGNGWSTFRFDPSIDPNLSGGIANPALIISRAVTNVSIAHSGSFTYDGKILVFGHEPGGGSQAQCQSGSSTVNKSIFFFDPITGTQLGTFLHPRPQLAQENCTWHNFNVIPTNRGYAFVSGNYQSGIYTVDFTNPAAAQLVGFADPARLGTGTGITLGGDWSTYWYDGHIYESDIRRGVITWRLDDRLTQGTRLAGRSNPQTQEVTFDLDRTAPTTTASLSPAPLNGWHVDPTVTLTADDGADGSGVDTTEYSLDGGPFTAYTGPFEVTGDGSHTVEYRSSDFALNVESTQTATFQVDATGPSVGVAPDRAPDSNGWYNHDVTFTATGADALSGVAACDAPVTHAGPDGAQAPVVLTCTDAAGNVGSGASDAFLYDETDPDVTLSSPSDGAVYLLDQFVLAGFGCGDATSGVASCVGTGMPFSVLDTGTVGFHTFTVDARDEAGNTRTVTHTYQVVWPFDEFYRPIEADQTNVAKAGSAVPVKFGLGGNRGLGIFAAGSPRAQVVSCDASLPTGAVDETATPGASTLSYSNGHYQYVWKTEKAWAGQCRELQVLLADGSVHTALFRFK